MKHHESLPNLERKREGERERENENILNLLVLSWGQSFFFATEKVSLISKRER